MTRHTSQIKNKKNIAPRKMHKSSQVSVMRKIKPQINTIKTRFYFNKIIDKFSTFM